MPLKVDDTKKAKHAEEMEGLDFKNYKPSYFDKPGVTEEDRDVERFNVRKEAYLKKLQRMYHIDRSMAEHLMDKMGGLSGVIKSFQMVDDEEIKQNHQKGQTLLESIRSTMGGYEKIKKEAEQAE